MGLLTNLMAKRCENCPFCKFARKNPESRIGKFIHWHGKFCPFWRAWEKVHGK